MSVPGLNLLDIALSAISPQVIQYFRETGRALNGIGQWVTSYDSALTLDNVSVQAVKRDKYSDYGLDFQKNYIRIYMQIDATDIERGKSGDKVSFSGKMYQLTSENNWFIVDGWLSVLAVEL